MLERGDLPEGRFQPFWLARSCNGLEEYGTCLQAAIEDVETSIDPDPYGEFDEYVDLMYWGIAVPIEGAHIEERATDNCGNTAEELGFDFLCEVTLRPVGGE